MRFGSQVLTVWEQFNAMGKSSTSAAAKRYEKTFKKRHHNMNKYTLVTTAVPLPLIPACNHTRTTNRYLFTMNCFLHCFYYYYGFSNQWYFLRYTKRGIPSLSDSTYNLQCTGETYFLGKYKKKAKVSLRLIAKHLFKPMSLWRPFITRISPFFC